jgi:6-pyruvoyltetrahydropterin/6-carboxytetrahydropterin synthase
VDRSGRYVLRLAKEDFKFAAAHFTVFPDGSAELLHGHNFRVSVVLEGGEPDALGLLAPLGPLKRRIRALCDQLDEHTLLPEKCPFLEVERIADGSEVRFRQRSYRLPVEDVTMLPIPNVTIELLARLLFDELAPALAGTGVDALSVEVEETAGQSCAYRAELG